MSDIVETVLESLIDSTDGLSIVQVNEVDSIESLGHSTNSSLVISEGASQTGQNYPIGERSSFTGPPVHVNSSSSGGSDVTASTVVLGPSGYNSAGGSVSDADSKNSSTTNTISTGCSARGTLLPWGAHKERTPHPAGPCVNSDMDIRPGEFVMRTLFADFTVQAAKKIEGVMTEPPEKSISKVLQRGEDPQFDQLLSAFGSVAEHCLPSLLRALFSWYERQMSDATATEQKKVDQKGKSIMYIVSGSAPETVERSEADIQQEKRDLAVEFIFCLCLIEVLRQLPFHPGHEDLVIYIENLAFRHFKYRDGIQSGPNAGNIHIIADLYAEVIGVLAQSRFMSVRKRFMAELKELRAKEPSPQTTQSVISLLMGMKFFRVKMVPIEEFEASFQFMQEAAQYFLEVKEKDIKHALAGLFVEILVPVAATVKNEVNVPCLKNFVEMLYSQTLDASTKSKHRLALFPLVTCLLCVSQKTFFLQNWHYFLAMCLSHLKNRDPKMSRVALESLYRLLWVYMIRIKCESNSATQSRLQSIVNSLFPKGSKAVVPRDTPLNIFVKIIQFIAQERLDFAMREIVFDLLSVGRPIKIILTPERMSIGLRAFLVVADSLQQKEGEPPMPRTMGVLPSGNTLRVRKTFLNKMLTEDTARSIGISSYFPHVRRVFVDILRALDVHYGRPLMMTSTQNVNKEPDEMITGERKPRIDLFRTCVAAVPRLIPDGMTGAELVDLLARLTVHMDEELRALSYQSLQTLVMDFPDWRQDVLWGFTQFLARDVQDTFPQLVDNGMRMLLQLLNSWKNALGNTSIRISGKETTLESSRTVPILGVSKKTEHKPEPVSSVLHLVEAFALVMLCNYRLSSRRLAVHILKDAKQLLRQLNCTEDQPIIDVIDKCCPQIMEKLISHLPPTEKAAALSVSNVDLQWIADRNACVWTAGRLEDSAIKTSASLNLNGVDPWNICLFEFLERGRVLTNCHTAVVHSWPIVFIRLNALFSVIDPTPPNDNRASLLRSSATVRKPVNERDMYIHIWKNYVSFAFRVVPPIPSLVIRCASPDLSLSMATEDANSDSGSLSQSLENLAQTQGFVTTGRFTLPLSAIRKQHKRTSSSPDSLTAERGGDNKAPSGNVSPAALYKLIVPLLRCETADVRDTAVQALGKVNPDALKDLMEELVVYIREAVDRKQENVRRRRRRDALRLQLVRVLELIAEYGTFGVSQCVLDRDSLSLHPTFVEYMDGARLYLESEPDKTSHAVREITLHFCNFVRKMIKSFSLETCQTLLKRDLRRNLFNLFSTSCGQYARPLRATSSASGNVNISSSTGPESLDSDSLGGTTRSELQMAALQAMSALLCCGSCFDPPSLAEDGLLYQWLDLLLASEDEKVCQLARETVILLLECNPDIGPLLDWVVDRCYTGTPAVADGCFLALATIFSAKEYPCDHYTAVINVTLMSTGCPRPNVRDTALQLLQLLDKRFFGTVPTLPATEEEIGIHQQDRGRGTLDALLSTTYCRSQMYLSRQLAQLHPELTMPMFSEITHRFQTARPEVRQLQLQYLLPWLHNMELVDPNVPPANPLSYYQYYTNDVGHTGSRREGWGSVEATEMVLNNVFYITAKFADEHPKEMEEVWSTLCSCWPNNLKVIIRYLIIVSGMAPLELLPYAKRVVLYLARARPDRLLDEMMTELQTVETLNCLIERTQTPPFYRLTSMRKASSHSDGGAGGVAGQSDPASRSELGVEKGTIHTKRHSGEDPIKASNAKSDSAIRMHSGFVSPRNDKSRSTSGPVMLSEDPLTPTTDIELQAPDGELYTTTITTTTAAAAAAIGLQVLNVNGNEKMNMSVPQPHPLPMPEYGGYFAPMTEYLPDSSQPISSFHRCNVAVMLLTDVVIDGVDLDWSMHVPLMLHILMLGMDHTRPLVHEHCKQLLLNLLVVLGEHCDHLTVAHILLNSKTDTFGLGLTTPHLPVLNHIFTESDPLFDSYLQGPAPSNSIISLPATTPSTIVGTNSTSSTSSNELAIEPAIIITTEDTTETKGPEPGPNMPIADVIKSLIDFLAKRQNQPLWNYEDITAKLWTVRSAEHIDIFLQHVLRVFRDSLPHAHINERWAQTALQLGLSCSSRHYAGRSLQIFRALRVPITSRMLSDILSRLVETVAEQGEDMQGYVTELLLTLEAAVDSLESDFRPLDFMKEIFKSTPNLNNKDMVVIGGKRSPGGEYMYQNALGNHMSYLNQTGHTRSTSYSVSYCLRKGSASPASDGKDLRCRGSTDIESRNNINRFNSTLSRSRSAQSLKLLGDSASQDDKMTILAQLFWLSVSLLESDYEHEFLLALRLLGRVLHRLPLDRPDARDKVEKLQTQLRWSAFPGVHALLLKGCTHPNIYENVVTLLSQFTPLLDLVVVDPSQSLAFPMNVVALLPYMLQNYEDANELCIRSAENIAQVSAEKSKKLENLGTVMTLYSRRNFSKESFQWTKCVVKYLYDTYAHLSLNMLAFLVEMLEKGPTSMQLPVLNIIHCMLHYVDLASAASQPINADLLRVIAKYIEGAHWKEALKILKLVVTRSSTLVAPPIQSQSHWESSIISSTPHPSFAESEIFAKKELPGRTMEFTFDLSQTPVIGRRFLLKNTTSDNRDKDDKGLTPVPVASPRRSCSLSPADAAPTAGWKRPWMSQGRVRECLVNLLTTCGQRVGLPKSPSDELINTIYSKIKNGRRSSVRRVIFSQSSDLMERQSSMASSTEEMSASGGNDLSSGSGARGIDAAAAAADQFGVFRDFDFLEYESESVEGESTDNFNWGVRRRPLSDGEQDLPSIRAHEESIHEKTPVLTKRKRNAPEESSDDEVGSESPLDELVVAPEFEASCSVDRQDSSSAVYPPSSLSLRSTEEHHHHHRHHRERRDSSTRSDTSGSSAGDLGDVTPCNTSPNISSILTTFRPIVRNDTEEAWRQQIKNGFLQASSQDNTLQLFQHLHAIVKDIGGKTVSMTRDSCQLLNQCAGNSSLISQLNSRLSTTADILYARTVQPTHIISFSSTALCSSKITDTLRYGVLEMQEHLETYFDRKDHASECIDAVKTALKLQLLGETQSDIISEELLLDLGRALYKLHFQFLLFIESANKMTAALTSTLKSTQLNDITNDLLKIKNSLHRISFDDTLTETSESGGGATPTPPPSLNNSDDLEGGLYELLTTEKWSAALTLVKHNRGCWLQETYISECDDDISTALQIFSKKVVQDKIDSYIMTHNESDLADVYARLFQVSASVADLETNMKEREQSSSDITNVNQNKL